MTDDVARTPREVTLVGLIIQARHWLDLLIEEFDIDPETTVMQARVLLEDQTDALREVCLQETLDALNRFLSW
jgi:hypothetical protein